MSIVIVQTIDVYDNFNQSWYVPIFYLYLHLIFVSVVFAITKLDKNKDFLSMVRMKQRYYPILSLKQGKEKKCI